MNLIPIQRPTGLDRPLIPFLNPSTITPIQPFISDEEVRNLLLGRAFVCCILVALPAVFHTWFFNPYSRFFVVAVDFLRQKLQKPKTQEIDRIREDRAASGCAKNNCGFEFRWRKWYTTNGANSVRELARDSVISLCEAKKTLCAETKHIVLFA